MSKLTIHLPYPAFIDNLFVFFLLRYRKKKYDKAFRRIKLLTNGPVEPEQRYVMVDPEDYESLSKYHWLLARTRGHKYYAVCYEGKQILHMHRMLMNAPKGMLVDHKDRNGLNNTKRNLRLATHSQNNCNRIISRPKSSKYRGVIYIKKTNKWRAGIAIEGKKISLGCFDNEEDAARAYDEAAKKLHGEFAILNFPEKQEIKIG